MPTRGDIAVSILKVRVGGSPLSSRLDRHLNEVVVDNNLYLPDAFTLRFQLNSIEGDELEIPDSELRDMLSEGTEIQIAHVSDGREKVFFDGMVTAVSLEFSSIIPSESIYAVVQGYDHSHKLHRGRKTRTFVKMTPSDIVSAIANEQGMTPSVDASSLKYEYAIQSNQTDWEFIWQLASRIGYEVYASGSTLHFKKPREDRGGDMSLAWGVELQQFRSRASTSSQWPQVKVRSWDGINKKLLTATADSGEGHAALKDSRTGTEQAQSAFGPSDLVVANVPVQDQSEADSLAASLSDAIAGEFIEAEGFTSWGIGDIQPGVRVNIKGLGRYDGRYYIVASTHRYSTMEGYTTSFATGGQRPNILSDYLGKASSSPALDRIQGVVVGLVTDNNDPDDLSRIKVEFPWLGDQVESNWARIAAPGAGSARGMHWLPEVGDEVLVAFEHGDIHRPYILGGLWNNTDQPPASNSGIVGGDGAVNLRSIKSRDGLSLSISDEAGKRHISLANPGDDSKITILHDDKVVEILSNGAINIKGSQGKITIEGQDIEIKSSSNLMIEASSNIDIKAGANLNLKGNAQATLEGLQAAVKGSAMTEVKGGLVKIN